MKFDDWLNVLDCTRSGPRSNATNAVRVLQFEPAFGAHMFWFDEFLDRVIVVDEKPRAWRNDDTTRLVVHMQEHAGMNSIGSNIVHEAVEMVARQRKKHMVKDWLHRLAWDRQPRITTAFTDFWGADDSAYVQAASRNFFIGMVARVMRPGCKLDTMPVFEGPQGIRKSSALEALASPAWFATVFENVTSKDFFQNMRGKWLLEIAELQSFGRADVTAVKSMLSTQSDTYRPSYGRVAVDYPRQSVFAGTTNVKEWADDETGLRRFWPIACGIINLDGIAANREQFFAEALDAYKADADWWTMPGGETLAAQEARQHQDEWIHIVRSWVALQPDGLQPSTADVLMGALRFDAGDIKKGDEMRIGRVMRRLNYVRGFALDAGTTSGQKRRVWLPESDSDTLTF